MKDEIYNKPLVKSTVFGFSCNISDEIFCFCTQLVANPGNTAGSDILFTRAGEKMAIIWLKFLPKSWTDSVVSLAPELFENSETLKKRNFSQMFL